MATMNGNGHITNGRSQTAPSGLMRLMVTTSPVSGGQPGVDAYAPVRKRTQHDQDQDDEQARKQAHEGLVNSWQERLQLISVITTFFASIETGLLAMTTPTADNLFDSSGALTAANFCLVGALIMHVYSAILSFLAAFLLIKYKLAEAAKEELQVEGIDVITTSDPIDSKALERDIERDIERDAESHGVSESVNSDEPNKKHGSWRRRDSSLEPQILARNPHLEQVGLFKHISTSHLLSRFHGLCILLASVGFVLALLGIILYAWALHPRSASIFGTVCLFLSMVAAVGMLFV